MSYNLQDVLDAEQKVRAELPHLHVDRWGDYGFKLAVIDHKALMAWILFQPRRDEIGQGEVRTNPEVLEKFIAERKAEANLAGG